MIILFKYLISFNYTFNLLFIQIKITVQLIIEKIQTINDKIAYQLIIRSINL